MLSVLKSGASLPSERSSRELSQPAGADWRQPLRNRPHSLSSQVVSPSKTDRQTDAFTRRRTHIHPDSAIDTDASMGRNKTILFCVLTLNI